MKKTLIILILVNWQIIKEQKIMDNSIYQFTVEDVDGEAFDFSCLEGKKIMIVNTASDVVSHINTRDYKPYMINIKIKTLLLVFLQIIFYFKEPGTNQQISNL